MLTSNIFQETSTIGKYSLDKINKYRKELKEGKKLKDIIEDINRELGDSIEKLLLIYEFSNQEDDAHTI